METITLDNDIKIFYVQATSYPDGIFDAHQKLHSIVPFSAERENILVCPGQKMISMKLSIRQAQKK